jgi:hypothetical protein
MRDLAAVRLALALDARDLRVFVAEYFSKTQEERRRTNTARSTGLRPSSSTKKAIEGVSSRGNAYTGFGTTPSGRQGFGQPGTDDFSMYFSRRASAERGWSMHRWLTDAER